MPTQPPIDRARPRPGLSLLVAALLLACCCALAAPGARAASIEGGNSFSELSQKAQEQETSTSEEKTTTTGSETGKESSSTGKGTIFIGAGAALVLLLGIAYVIVRDARRVAPAGAEDIDDGPRGRDPAVQMRKRRAKARAAKKQRKKNR